MIAPTFVCNDSNRADWLEQRRSGIGGSDAPVCLGISPFSSRAKLAAEKQGLVPMGDEESELMSWGRKVEPLLIANFLDEMTAGGEKAWMAKPSGKLFRSAKPGREVMMSTPDGDVIDPAGRSGIIECKLKIFGAAEWDRFGVPEHVVAQSQHNADVKDADFALVLGLLDGYRPRWKVLERDDELVGDVIVPAELEFWEWMQAGEAFPIDEGPQAANDDLLRRLYPDDDGSTVRLEGARYVELAREWRMHAETRLAADKSEKSVKLILREALGGATYGLLDNGTELSLKTTKKAASMHKASSSRTLREVSPTQTAKRRGRR